MKRSLKRLKFLIYDKDMENDKLKFLYDSGLWWMFLGSLVSADVKDEDKGKAKELLEELIADIPKSNLPEDVKEKSLEFCTNGLEIINRDII